MLSGNNMILNHFLSCLLLRHIHRACSSTLVPHAARGTYDKGVSKVDRTSTSYNHDFFTFVTRPDIVAPRWNVSIYDENALALGCWFMATYEYVDQDREDNREWIGPFIYDQVGELIWSGAPSFEGYNVKDFRVSKVNGTDMLTGIYTMGGFGVVLNSSYQVHDLLYVENGSSINIHDFHTVDEGAGYLTMTLKSTFASEELLSAIGCPGSCELEYAGFEERDSKTMELRFEWSAQDHISVDESYLEPSCNGIWDFLHANSVDKFPDGDYLLSGRHTDTLYKISGKNGSIIWKFGGKYSDFEFDDHFSGQHDARIHTHTETYTVISILDNAIRPGILHSTSDQSRGMVIGFHTDSMVAKVLRTYNHPRGGFAVGRGNFQALNNGNAFLSWWMQCLISENEQNGRLLMEASWIPKLKSYRSYKFKWAGYPVDPPDVFAKAIKSGREFQTSVHVSWNGATEVDRWAMHKTSKDGRSKDRLATFERKGFETEFVYYGFERYIMIEGLDFDGNSLGESLILEIEEPREKQWIQGITQAQSKRIRLLMLFGFVLTCSI